MQGNTEKMPVFKIEIEESGMEVSIGFVNNIDSGKKITDEMVSDITSIVVPYEAVSGLIKGMMDVGIRYQKSRNKDIGLEEKVQMMENGKKLRMIQIKRV